MMTERDYNERIAQIQMEKAEDERVTPSGFRHYKMIRSDEDTNNYTLVFLIEIGKDTLFHVGIDDIIENIMHAMNYNAVRTITLDDVRDFFDGFSNVPDKTWETYEKKHIGRFRLEWVHDNHRGSFFVKLTRQANPLTMMRNTDEGLEGMI